MDQGGPFPERQVEALRSRLRRHRLWDRAAVVLPPFLALSYLAGMLLATGWIAPDLTIPLVAGLSGLLLLGFLFLLNLRFPSSRLVAGLVDRRVEGKDRFLTLATIESSRCPPSLLHRLRREAGALLHRIDPKRDFPYRLKRSFATSLIASFAILALFHLFYLAPRLFAPVGGPGESLRPLVQKLSQTPGLEEMAQKLESLLDQLKDRHIANPEKLTSLREILRQVENFHGGKGQSAGEGGEEMKQLAQALRGLERAMEEKGEGGDGGGLKANLPDQDNRDGQKLAKGSGSGEGSDQAALAEGPPTKGGKAARDPTGGEGQSQGGSSKGEGRQEGVGQGGKEIEGQAKGRKEGKGRTSQGETVPTGVEPERYFQRGESGERELEGARFVIVKLPEAESPSSQGGEGRGTGKAAAPKVPVSNVPLSPSRVPEAAGEKQRVPLEYRGFIR